MVNNVNNINIIDKKLAYRINSTKEEGTELKKTNYNTSSEVVRNPIENKNNQNENPVNIATNNTNNHPQTLKDAIKGTFVNLVV